MGLKQKIGVAMGALVISGGLLAGVAMANEAPADASTPAAGDSAQVEKVGPLGQLSEGAKSVLNQLNELRKSYAEKFQADAKALTEKAVAEGTITQAEADRLGKFGGRGFGGEHIRIEVKGAPLTEEELKAKLDEAVKAGKMTQEQADKILQSGGKMLKFRDEMKGGHGMRFFKGGPGMMGEGLQSKLDAAVEAGTITAEQAAKLMESLKAAR
jgi:polyhydroxyalkanoate synthesis regulator phasin